MGGRGNIQNGFQVFGLVEWMDGDVIKGEEIGDLGGEVRRDNMISLV